MVLLRWRDKSMCDASISLVCLFADRTCRMECCPCRHEFCKSNEGKECYGWKVKVETMCYPSVGDVAAKIHGAEEKTSHSRGLTDPFGDVRKIVFCVW